MSEVSGFPGKMQNLKAARQTLLDFVNEQRGQHEQSPTHRFALDRILCETDSVAIQATVTQVTLDHLELSFSIAFKRGVQVVDIDNVLGERHAWDAANDYAIANTVSGIHAYFMQNDPHVSNVYNVTQNVITLRNQSNSMGPGVKSALMQAQDRSYLDMVECNPTRGFCDMMHRLTLKSSGEMDTLVSLHSERAMDSASYSTGLDERWTAIRQLRQCVAAVLYDAELLDQLKSFSSDPPEMLDFVKILRDCLVRYDNLILDAVPGVMNMEIVSSCDRVSNLVTDSWLRAIAIALVQENSAYLERLGPDFRGDPEIVMAARSASRI